MREFLGAAILIVSVSACAPEQQPPQMAWHKAGASNVEFQRDSYGCMNEAARSFPATAGVEGISDEEGGVISSYDINQGNRNNAASTCLRIKGWQLVPRATQSSAAPVVSASAATTDPTALAKARKTCRVTHQTMNDVELPPAAGLKVTIVQTATTITATIADLTRVAPILGTQDGTTTAGWRLREKGAGVVITVGPDAFILLVEQAGKKLIIMGPCP
jgi:hypothetical protein